MTKNNEQIEKIYICNYGQTEFPVCVDLGHEYCKLDFQKSKECNLRAVVSYDDYLRKEQECEELKEENFELKEEVSIDRALFEEIDQLKKENEELKAEIKLSKEMLIQNTSETNKYTIPQIIEQFISDNYIDQQDDDGYTIPIFLQLEDILYEKESLEEKLGLAETSKGLQRIEIEKLKQTLEEIREIAKENVGYFPDGEMFARPEIEQIINKINEVIDDKSND